jgi:hypothetical protein
VEAHEVYDYAAQVAWKQVEQLNDAAETAWEEYDAALSRARLAEDAMWAAHQEAERLSRAARHQKVKSGASVVTEARNGRH